MAILNYQGLSESSGIYVIFNSHNWRLYVGSSMRFKTRWKDGHLGSLKNGKHSNKFFQADYNKCKALFGHDDFLEFHVLENMPGSSREERLAAEERWLALHWDGGVNCYNLCARAISREGSFDKKQRKIRSDKGSGKQVYYVKKGRKYGLVPWNKGKRDCYSEDTLAAMSLGKCGKTLSEQHKKKISDSNIGRKTSEDTKIKISEACRGPKNHNFGKQMSQKCRMALLKSNMNRNMTEITKKAVAARAQTYDIVLQDSSGNLFGPITNLSQFCREHDLERSLLTKMINGKRNHHKGWTLVKVSG